jgi:hypothetical protein
MAIRDRLNLSSRYGPEGNSFLRVSRDERYKLVTRASLFWVVLLVLWWAWLLAVAARLNVGSRKVSVLLRGRLELRSASPVAA